MKNIQILVPMAGAGSRFANEGYYLPKPLIPVDGVPMFQKAISSLDGLEVNKEFIFVIQKEHDVKYDMKNTILSIVPDAKVVLINKLTGGAVETCMQAKQLINKKLPLIVLDCDLWFYSKAYLALVKNVIDRKSNIAGGLLTFASNNPRYSFAQIDRNNKLIKTAEKNPISNNAIAGAYFFSDGQTFIEAAEALLARPINSKTPEYYMSYIYNIILDKKGVIGVALVEDYASFGTPIELKEYEKNH